MAATAEELRAQLRDTTETLQEVTQALNRLVTDQRQLHAEREVLLARVQRLLPALHETAARLEAMATREGALPEVLAQIQQDTHECALLLTAWTAALTATMRVDAPTEPA